MSPALFALVTLFNGQNLDGWRVLSGDWAVAEGTLVCTAPVSAIRSCYEADRYTLALQYRRSDQGWNALFVNAGANSGGLEIRLLPQGAVDPAETQADLHVPRDEWINLKLEVSPEAIKATSSRQNGRKLHEVRWENVRKTRGRLRIEASRPGLELRGLQAREDGFRALFDGKTLQGWEIVGQKRGKETDWLVEDGVIACRGQGGGTWLRTLESHDNFVMRLEYFLPAGGNSGIYCRAPLQGRVSQIGLEIQLLDDVGWWHRIKPSQRNGSVYAGIAPEVLVPAPPLEWNTIEVLLQGQRVRTVVNGVELYDARLDDVSRDAMLLKNPLTTRRLTGFIGFQDHNHPLKFRNIRLKELLPPASQPASLPAK